MPWEAGVAASLCDRSSTESPGSVTVIRSDASASEPSTMDASLDAEEEDIDDLGDWNLVAERPERLLELQVGVPLFSGHGSSICPKKIALHTLTAASKYAVDSTTRYAALLLQLLPQQSRELVDATRAYAWVHLRAEEKRRPSVQGDVPQAGASQVSWDRRVQNGYYTACINSRPGGRQERCEVLVVTLRGCAHVYEWNSSVGGECRLCAEHAFSPEA